MTQSPQKLRQFLILGCSLTGVIIAGLSFTLQRNLKQALLLGGITGGISTGVVLYGFRDRELPNLSPEKPKSAVVSPPPITSPKSQELAVFWDYENIKVPTQNIQPAIGQISDYLETLGFPVIKNVYSKWNHENQSVQQSLYSFGFNLIQVSSPRKNSVDIRLTIDCLNAIFERPQITQLIIITNDADFSELINDIKRKSKTAIVIGEATKISQQLRENASEFIKLDSITKLPQNPLQTSSQTISYQDAVNCLIEAIKDFKNQGVMAYLGSMDTKMRQYSPNYKGVQSIIKIEDLQFSKFNDFIEQIEKDGKITIDKTKAGNQVNKYILKLVDNQSNSESEIESIAYDDAVRYLVAAVSHLKDNNKQATIGRIGKTMIDMFPDYGKCRKIAKKGNQKEHFSRLSKFLESVERDGKIRIQTGEHTTQNEVCLIEGR
ncbi:MAG: NYN domain-containing protein [Jaaginema sp. PMC 1079.18]|nr:NYN domain-containing protein [Jaaginema sp. PMC 1080.18]MEC4852619.1 NYN domain-containing protein [Jaaginema sp. PMC 1079.18]MEC4866836.1 NYN domain-containing protein [Jaaginema sp. PMC 1078.18]